MTQSGVIPIETQKPENWDGLTREQLREWFEKHGQNLGALAGYTRRSRSALSQWFAGLYEGDERAVGEDLLKVKALLTETGAQPKAMAEHYVETSIAKEIMTTLKVARLDKDLAVIYGAAGQGKTAAAVEYAKRQPGVFYTDLDYTSTVYTIARRLCNWLHVEFSQYHLDETLERICKALQGRDLQIIIDQAEFLIHKSAAGYKTSALEFVRTIYDKAGVSICLVCLPSFYEVLVRNTRISDYILSRVGIRRELRTCVDADVAAWARAHGVSDEGAIKELAQRKDLKGHMRKIRLAAKKALRMARATGKPCDAAMVREAFGYIF
jgi:DNA transposition AAA+ family ATPase